MSILCLYLYNRETWYYGLQFEDISSNIVWLKLDKKVLDQHSLPPPGTLYKSIEYLCS